MYDVIKKLLPRGFLIPKMPNPKVSLVPSNYQLEEGWKYDTTDSTVEHLQRISFFKRFDPDILITMMHLINIKVQNYNEIVVPLSGFVLILLSGTVSIFVIENGNQ